MYVKEGNEKVIDTHFNESSREGEIDFFMLKKIFFKHKDRKDLEYKDIYIYIYKHCKINSQILR